MKDVIAEVAACPRCGKDMYVRRWKENETLFGSQRDCSDKGGCGYNSSWVQDNLRGTLSGVSVMRSNKIMHSVKEIVVNGPETVN